MIEKAGRGQPAVQHRSGKGWAWVAPSRATRSYWFRGMGQRVRKFLERVIAETMYGVADSLTLTADRLVGNERHWERLYKEEFELITRRRLP